MTVVIGQKASHVSKVTKSKGIKDKNEIKTLKENAMSHVLGYTVAHDVSARDWQLKRLIVPNTFFSEQKNTLFLV